MRRRKFTVWLSLILFGLTSCSLFQREPEVELRTDVVSLGSINEVVSATGVVTPIRQVSVFFTETGIVDEVYVKEGDSVDAGDPLARLDDNLAQVSVEQARLALELARLEYDRLFLPPNQSQISAAEAALASAVAAYRELTAPADQATFEALLDQRQDAQAVVDDAQERLAEAQERGATEAELQAIEFDLKDAEINAWLLELQLQQISAGVDQNTRAAAQAAINQAQAELSSLLAGPGPLDIRHAEILIDQAQLAYERALATLDDLTLRAPFAGLVADVAIEEGALPSSSQPAFTLVDASHLYVQVEVDELDIGRLISGQPAVLTFDAFPGQEVGGVVSLVYDAPITFFGVTSYQADIEPESVDLLLRPGMTASVEIIVLSLENVLLVPNWAIRFDRQTGNSFVSVLNDDGAVVEVSVELGLRGDMVSQVLSGLEEGQTVAVELTPTSVFDEMMDN